MGLFGKKKDEDEESSRKALFGSRNKSKSSAPPSSNPYATPAAPPDPYTQAKMKAGIIAPLQQPESKQALGQAGQPDPRGSAQSFGSDKTLFGGQTGYAPNRYGNQNGYGGPAPGANPYAGVAQTSGTQRSGGYGGLGPTKHSDAEPDENRDALFGAAPQRVKQQEQQNGPPDYTYDNPSESRSYGAYGDRQLTAEEEEEEDISATKTEIRNVKQDTASRLQNAARIGAQAEETGRNTLARLGAQGERLHNTKKNLDLAQNQITHAEDQRAELQRLNRSMFIPANSPFGRKGRIQRQEEKIMKDHTETKQNREETRATAYDQQQRMNQNFKSMNEPGTRASGPGGRKTNLAERGKYQFEADSDDERLEDDIDDGLEAVSGAASRMNMIAKALGEEIDSQNTVIEKIGIQSDAIDDRVVMETARLKRIK